MLVLALVLTAFPSARLVEGALREDTFVNPNVSRMTLPELREERLRLQREMPGIRGAVTLMIAVPTASLTTMLFGALLGSVFVSNVTTLYVIAAVVGGVALVAGIVWLVVALRMQNAVKDEIARVDDRIHTLSAPPPPTKVLPPPGVWLPVAPLQLARF